MVNLRSASTMAGALDDATVRAFTATVQGEVLDKRDDGYESARRVFNGMIDRRPTIIFRCTGRDDVVRGVNFARKHGLSLSIRGGGHSVAGNAVCEGGMMLDLSGMKSIRVDPVKQIAVAESGLTLAEFDRATQAHGLATTLGIVSVTGIAGLTLGGGIGWLNGKYGLACDNLLAAEVVTANGEVITASADENDDLLWGLRGGGGNFGVVTSFTYRLHPVETVLAGAITFPAERVHDAMRFYHAFTRSSPDELSTAGMLTRDADGHAMFSVALCYCGDISEGERVLQPLRSFGPPAADMVGPMEYCAFQSGGDAGFPEGRQHYWKSSFLQELSDNAIDTLLLHVAQMPSPFSVVGMQQISGVASRVDPAATAFAHRAQQYDCSILSQWADPADTERNVTWTRAFFAAMEPFLERGVYANNLGEEGEDRVRAAYGTNYDALTALKARYDPTNLFHLNQNVKPKL
jgi:FAD/FMN-containing dehydrogenase